MIWDRTIRINGALTVLSYGSASLPDRFGSLPEVIGAPHLGAVHTAVLRRSGRRGGSPGRSSLAPQGANPLCRRTDEAWSLRGKFYIVLATPRVNVTVTCRMPLKWHIEDRGTMC